jgi:hypothetical protein
MMEDTIWRCGVMQAGSGYTEQIWDTHGVY